MKEFQVRNSNGNDFKKILELYKTIAEKTIGIARDIDEVNESYINHIMTASEGGGIELVVEDPDNSEKLIAEIHCFRLNLKIFNHILGDLTIVVHPNFQGNGIGKLIFSKLINIIEKREEILRVELQCRETNIKGIELYKKIGFELEGRLRHRTLTKDNIEDDLLMAWINPNFKRT